MRKNIVPGWIISGILIFWDAIDWILAKAEHAEFISQHIPWLAQMMEYMRQLFETPAWVSWTIPILGLLFLLWLYWPAVKERFRGIKSKPVYLTANQLVHYLADESQWGFMKARARTPEGMYYFVPSEAPLEFAAKAAEGKIRVYGLNPRTKMHELIDKTHWMSYGLSYSTIFDPTMISKTVATTPGASLASAETTYSDLKIDADDVYRIWPRRAMTSTA